MKREIFSRVNVGDKFFIGENLTTLIKVNATYYRDSKLVNAVYFETGKFAEVSNNTWVTVLSNVGLTLR